ncbi:hypothetical protein I3843_05G195300 [Carya illinoinensis]|nr:hypothetical protein I3843_05G195300 [Carya illinoinensis]KAG7980689.1 hypothetical protein I3843_05G195300 [Carya illinoinensis]
MAFPRMLFQVVCVVVMLSKMPVVASLAQPNCQNRCGDVEIPYPFGTTENCYLNDNYFISCHNSQPLWANHVVTNISIQGELEILMFIANQCVQNSSGVPVVHNNRRSLTFPTFTISNTKNKFVAAGCDTLAYLNAFRNNEPFTIGCISICQSLKNVVNGSCSGIGCCQAEIPAGLKNYTLEVYSYYNHTNVSEFNPCSSAFVAKQDEFKFSSDYLEKMLAPDHTFPMVLDWAIGTYETCETARSKPNYVCGQNTASCDNPPEGVGGYRCKCNKGYEGNPYLHEGCQDINECLQVPNPCNATAICTNTDGSFTCTCPNDYVGDGKMNGTGCSPKASGHAKIIIAKVGVSTSLGVLFLIFGGWWSYKVIKKKMRIKRKEKFFKRNGGLLLQQQLFTNTNKVNVENTKLFNSKELEKATDDYSADRIIGHGGQGTVYKGMLADGRIVAIKKSNIIDEDKLQEFINEVVILSQINHRNVVKMLGCCLETEVPLLVYEFIPNGTLAQYLNGQNEEVPPTWDMRLRIAIEVAGAIFYLHSAASSPIYHRDIKSTNILLDEKYRAKVADFGISRSVAIDQTHLSTLVHGTFGYVDPEYFRSSQFTDKSDVYSFGVVLAELLTREKAILSSRTRDTKSLAAFFVSSMEGNNLFDILDNQVLKEAEKEKIIAVANLVKRCLNLNGKERPSMREVAMELEANQISPKVSNPQGEYREIEDIKTEISKQYDVSISTSCMDGILVTSSSDSQPLILSS